MTTAHPAIDMHAFLDFALNPIGAQAVRQAVGLGAPFVDFYRPLRETIVGLHIQGDGPQSLDDFVQARPDGRERHVFAKVATGYQKFLARWSNVTWFDPPFREHQLGALTVRVNPEVGLMVDGRPHAIKLYLRGDLITPARIKATIAILSGALGVKWPATVVSVLDVRRARLYTPRAVSKDTVLQLEGAAAAFDAIRRSL